MSKPSDFLSVRANFRNLYFSVPLNGIEVVKGIDNTPWIFNPDEEATKNFARGLQSDSVWCTRIDIRWRIGTDDISVKKHLKTVVDKCSRYIVVEAVLRGLGAIKEKITGVTFTGSVGI